MSDKRKNCCTNVTNSWIKCTIQEVTGSRTSPRKVSKKNKVACLDNYFQLKGAILWLQLLNQHLNNYRYMNKNYPYVTARLNLFREIFLKPTKVAMKPRTLQIFCFDHPEESFSYKISKFHFKSFVYQTSVKKRCLPLENINENPPFIDLQRKSTSDQLNNSTLFQGDNLVIWVLNIKIEV